MPRPQAPSRWPRPRAAIVAVAASLALFAIAPEAQAAFSLGGLSAKPTNANAGANSDFSITIGFPDAGSDVKDLTVHLPPGQVGNRLAAPICTVSQLNADSCSAASQVGTVSTDATVTALLVGVPITVSGKVFNLIPPPGEPARFGIVLKALPLPAPLSGLILPPTILQSAVHLRPTDFGLDTVINNIPNEAGVAAGVMAHIHVTSMTVTLDGHVGGNPFMRNPTSCATATTRFDADSYSSTNAPTGAASYTPTNCGALDFSPTFSARIGSPAHTDPGTKPPLTTVVAQDPGEAGAQRVDAILPTGVGADGAQLGRQCSVADFGAGTCPANTIVGAATAASPFLTTPLAGPVSIVAPAAGQPLPRLGVDLRGPLHIQLFGNFLLTPGPGNSFVGLPDIPLSRFTLNFSADGLITTSRDLCAGGAPTFQTTLTGWNGATRSGNVAADVQGCGSGGGGGGGGGGGTGSGHAKPKAKIAVTRAASKKPRLKLTISDEAKLRKAKLTLPKRLRFVPARAKKLEVRGGRRKAIKPHSVVVRARGGTKLLVKAGGGVVRRQGKIAGRRLHFKLSVRDGAGRAAKLRLTAKARR